MLVKSEQAPLPELPNKTQVYNYVQKYAKANNTQAWWELLSSLALHVIIIASPFKWIFFLILVGLRVRMFVIFHDMGHLSFFSNSTLNRIVGTLIGPLVWTPYSYWVSGHNKHHKVSNNLDKSQYAQSSPWTVQEFHQHNKYIRWLYAAVYGQYTFWTIVPAIYFLVIQRLYARWHENLLHLCWVVSLLWWSWDSLKFDILIMFVAALGGFFFFHVQHTFPGAYRKRSKEWDYYENGMRGSSYLQLPWYIAYFTFGIQYHHIHHLNTRVPGYKLQKCHDEANGLFDCVPHLTFMGAVKTFPLSLYNESIDTFVSVYSELSNKKKAPKPPLYLADDNNHVNTKSSMGATR